jgi:biopolymer transport protein TolR
MPAVTAMSSRTGVQSTPNVTPMIDVMLVLLIIFMLVVPVLHNQVQPPVAANASARPEETSDRTLVIDAAGRYWLDKQPIRSASLGAALEQLVARKPDDRVLFVRADQSLDYGVVRDAMATAASSGMRVVGLVTVSRTTDKQHATRSP